MFWDGQTDLQNHIEYMYMFYKIISSNLNFK